MLLVTESSNLNQDNFNQQSASENPQETSSHSNSSFLTSELQHTPSRKVAIVLNNTNCFTQDQLLRAVADRVGSQNINYCSKLSGGRFCVYFSNEAAVNKICQSGGVLINSTFISCRKYVSDATNFKISNCPPEMPDEELLKLLAPFGKPVSKPVHLRVSTTHEDLKHIKTWKRSLFMQVPNNAPPCPKVMHITSAEGVKHTLYIETNHNKQDMNATSQAYIAAPSLRLSKARATQPEATMDHLKTSSNEDYQNKQNLTSKPTRPPPSPLTSDPARPSPCLLTSSAVLPPPPPLPPPLSISLPAPSPNLSKDPEQPPNYHSLSVSSNSKKRLHSPQSPSSNPPKAQKQSIASPEITIPEVSWTVVQSPNPEITPNDPEIHKIVSSMSFNDHKLKQETFEYIISQCKMPNVNIRRFAYKYRYIYKFCIDYLELVKKLDEAYSLCENNIPLKNAIMKASQEFHTLNLSHKK